MEKNADSIDFASMTICREQLLGAPSNRYTFGWAGSTTCCLKVPGHRVGRGIPCSTPMAAPAGAADVVHGFHAKSFG